MARSTFSERFGFARWLRHLATGESPGFAEIGRAVERTGPAVGAWLQSDDPPPDWRVHEPLATFFGVDERWLIRDQGEPPRPELWPIWIAARRRKSTSHERVLKAVAEPSPPKYEGPPMYVGEPVTPRKPAAKKVAEGGKKKR